MRIGNLEIKATPIEGCYEIIPDKYGDNRGSFQEVYQKKRFGELGFSEVFQANESESCKGTLRGLHFQKPPYIQTKIVRVTKGRVLDFVVDLRVDSPTYKQFYYVELSEEANNQLYVPAGLAHGFLALTDAKFLYLVDKPYAPKYEGGVRYDDPELGISWQKIMEDHGIKNPILSDKDLKLGLLKEISVTFKMRQEKYLITGYNGQLGYDIRRELLKNGIRKENILTTDVNNMDITDKEQVKEVISGFKPDVIFHCAAWTAVDKAEGNRELVRRVNVDGCRNITEAAVNVGAKVVYLSTDYVFDGTKDGLYTSDDEPNPQSVYGETKLLGEVEIRKNPKHFISRISWVFGINGNNFIRKMLELAETHEELTVVDDQIGSPTYTVDLAHLLYYLSQTDNYGTYHVTNEGFCSWAEFAEYIMRTNHKDTKIIPVSTDEYYKGIEHAFRPHNSRLDKSTLDEIGLFRLPPWQDAVDRYNDELEAEAMVFRRFKQ